MRTSRDPVRLGLGVPKVSWLASVPLAMFAFGTPLDSMIASQIGSSSLVLGAPLVASACWRVLVTNRLRPPPGSLVLMAGFAAWGATSVLWARDQDLLQIWLITHAQLVVFVLLCWQVVDSEWALSAALAGFLAGCIGLVASVWRAYLTGQALGDQTYEGGTRYSAEGLDPNDMGVTLAIGIPMAAYLALSGGRRTSYLALSYVPLAGSAITLCGSRGATLTALVAVLGVLLWFGTCRRNAFALVLALLAAGLVLAWHLIPWEVWARLFTLREQLAGGGSMGDRTQIWRAGLDVFARHPVAGVGAGGFSDSVVPMLGRREAAHSTLLSVAVELGGIGLLLYASAFAVTLWGVFRQAADQRSFGLTLLASWLVGSASLSWEHRKATWLVLLLCAALGTMRGQAEQRELA